MITPLSLLQQGVESLAAGYDPASGLLNDPVFGCPTQYSTPYYAWCNAVLAAHSAGGQRADYAGRARQGLRATLDTLLDPSLPPYPSEFRRDTGASNGRNHRDFFWPPALKSWKLLDELGELDEAQVERAGYGYAQFSEALARVDPLAAFAMRPPNNWAAVWLCEWLRMRAGLSPFSLAAFDDWLGEYFRAHVLLERGFYQEPGHPNSYDLFTRLHFADILLNGYAGHWRPEMEALLASGLRRSLLVQLSDGSLASAHRSTAQSWTDGAQVAFFTLAASFFASRDSHLAGQARQAASRAFASLARWQRPDGPFSPVYNLLPPEMRVGYEPYTADGHYSTLALAFLASALQAGFTPVDFSPRAPQALIENDPIWRAVLHHGDTSLQVNAFPAPEYDAFGITDLTFGPRRWLHFASSVRFLETGQLFNPGLALSTAAMQHGPQAAQVGLSAVEPAAKAPFLIEPLQAGDSPASLRLLARPRGAFYPYGLEVELEPAGARVREWTPGRRGARTLLVPFLLDPGGGRCTRWQFAPGRLELATGNEAVTVEWDGPAERALVLAQGFENRRGLCALARIDLAEEGEELNWRIYRVR